LKRQEGSRSLRRPTKELSMAEGTKKVEDINKLSHIREVFKSHGLFHLFSNMFLILISPYQNLVALKAIINILYGHL
jgi:hypothetical protein